jgi:hypothetical protein
MTKIYLGETNTNSQNGIQIIKTHLSVKEVQAAIIKAEEDAIKNNSTKEAVA